MGQVFKSISLNYRQVMNKLLARLAKNENTKLIAHLFASGYKEKITPHFWAQEKPPGSHIYLHWRMQRQSTKVPDQNIMILTKKHVITRSVPMCLVQFAFPGEYTQSWLPLQESGATESTRCQCRQTMIITRIQKNAIQKILICYTNYTSIVKQVENSNKQQTNSKITNIWKKFKFPYGVAARKWPMMISEDRKINFILS